jgi:xylan 1,4-beta-xylosidase
MKTSARLLASFTIALSYVLGASGSATAQKTEVITLGVKSPTTPFPHFWEQTFGSGRAILSLRQSYRDDMRTVKDVTNFQSVRFHGIFNDEVGLYDPNRRSIAFAQMKGGEVDGGSPYNFSYIDQIYDGLLALHVRPFVELSFMPAKMASDPKAIHHFWYHPNVSPPSDYELWDSMIRAFAQHLVDRYGLGEVSTWNFEVWNEPNIGFWAGKPKQSSYFELYDHTARDIKSVSPLLKVGGPATAEAAWITPFLQHAKDVNAPVDFVSTHVYANDTAENVFGTDEQIPRDQMVFRAVQKVHEEIQHSPFPALPLIFSEFNASHSNEPNVTDTDYIGPWLANTIRLCDGLVQNMSYWTFSDVFEEQGVVRRPFYGGFGLIAADNIPKPALHIFAALHKMGDRRLALASDSALATLTSQGRLVLALWNYAPPTGTGHLYTAPSGTSEAEKKFDLSLKNVNPSSTVSIYRIDDDYSNVLKVYDAMGRPDAPTLKQISILKTADAVSPPLRTHLERGHLNVSVPAHGLAIVLVE